MKNSRNIFSMLSVVSILLIGGYLVYFFVYLKYVPSRDPGDWGTFGDFVGGSLNPFIGLAGLYLLMKTLEQNEKALKQAEKSLEKMDKALKQSEEALRINAEELRLSRVEFSGSKQAQKELAEIESNNLKMNRAIHSIDNLVSILEYERDYWGEFKKEEFLVYKVDPQCDIYDLKKTCFRMREPLYRQVFNDTHFDCNEPIFVDEYGAKSIAGFLRHGLKSAQDTKDMLDSLKILYETLDIEAGVEYLEGLRRIEDFSTFLCRFKNISVSVIKRDLIDMKDGFEYGITEYWCVENEDFDFLDIAFEGFGDLEVLAYELCPELKRT